MGNNGVEEVALPVDKVDIIISEWMVSPLVMVVVHRDA
jgi:hypothetical protein